MGLPIVSEGARAALELLVEGNERYVAGRAAHPRQDDARREATAGDQRPFAAVMSCADSRVPPEVLFDQGLGDLFCVRTAGQVADGAAIGSLELAVTLYQVPLLVVMGHTGCGAVLVTLDHVRSPGQLPGCVSSIVWAITPAAREATHRAGDDAWELAVELNVAATVARLAESRPTLAGAVERGELAVVGAVYDLRSGMVRWLTPAPPTPCTADVRTM